MSVLILMVHIHVNAIVDISCNLMDTLVHVEVDLLQLVVVSRHQTGLLATHLRTLNVNGSSMYQILERLNLQLMRQHLVSKDVLHVLLITLSSLME